MTRLSGRFRFLLFLAAILLLAGSLALSYPRSSNKAAAEDLERFAEVYKKVMLHYVDEPASDELIDAAIEAMLGELDPFTQIMDDTRYDDLMVRTKGEFGGLGIVISIRNDYPTVISPIDDTPAARLGIRGGDQIAEIEGEDTKGWKVEDAVKHLRGPKGTPVEIGIRRFGDDEIIPFTITRDIIKVKSVPYYFTLENDLGYLRCVSFGEKTAGEMRDALVDLQRQGIRGLVVDLRNNPGGLLEAARDVVDLFIDKDRLIVSTNGRSTFRKQELYSLRRPVLEPGIPLVLLINRGSASASEILAGAVQDWDRGLVIGDSSFGKGSVQSVFPIPGEGTLKLTTAKYYTPSGRCIHRDELFSPGAMDELEAAGDSLPEWTETPPESLPTYSTLLRTRQVRGGGGIIPDILLKPDEISDLALDLERRATFFNFAVQLGSRVEVSENIVIDDLIVTEFRSHIDDLELDYEGADFEASREYVATAIKRELLYSKFGSAAAYRATMGRDRVLQEALGLLRESGSLDELFAHGENLNEERG